MKKICVITGSRAEYGVLEPLLLKLEQSPHFELFLVVTGSHLEKKYGLTIQEIKKQHYKNIVQVAFPLKKDTPEYLLSSLGQAIPRFSKMFKKIQPDLLLFLGDRYELLAPVTAALLLNIPMAHLYGGELTFGAIDDSIRHMLTKASHLHFVSHDQAQKRVIQMGESPQRVFNVGSLSIDHIKKLTFMSQNQFEEKIGFKLRQKNLLVTFHPVTRESEAQNTRALKELLSALNSLSDDYGIIITAANSDPMGKRFNQALFNFAAQKSNRVMHYSLGHELYLNAVRFCNVVVGNSSSGLIEVPSFQKPTINIGNRQLGRMRGDSVIDTQPLKKDILRAIQKALKKNFSRLKNPYGDGKSTQRIVRVLTKMKDPRALLNKRFYDVSNR